MSTGKRFNNGKMRWRNVPNWMLEEVIKVGEFGEVKYGTYNFLKGLPLLDTLDSLHRHLNSFENPYEPDYDHETKINHLAHVAWNAITALHMTKHRPDLDDRYKVDTLFDDPVKLEDHKFDTSSYIELSSYKEVEVPKKHKFKFEKLDQIKVGAMIAIVVERYYNEDFKPIYLLKTDKGEMFSEAEYMLEMATVDVGG
ncbi:MAG: hypothetical protein COB41_00555 [Proteobacteria bacterium]|nr:MAG: hypothetical protein COB41_00555 [Pseudomonadota bacterium]